MRAQRPSEAAPALAGSAESLPLDDDSVDAAMACVTIHHWPDRARGLAELRRVARERVVVFTFDLAALPEWQRDYFGQAIGEEIDLFGTPEEVAAELGGVTRIESIPIPAECVDGFVEAFWNRPEALLDPEVRASQSLWERFDESELTPMFERLAADLESGAWDERHGHLRGQDTFEGSLRLIISEPAPA